MIEIKNNIVRLDGKAIGRIESNALFMRRTMQKHHYRVLDAWCLNVETVNVGVDKFIIDAGAEIYTISVGTIKKLRTYINMFVTFGKERQLAIPLKCWDKYEKTNKTFPVYIGMSPDAFAESCTGRWTGRLIAFSQMEIVFQRRN